MSDPVVNWPEMLEITEGTLKKGRRRTRMRIRRNRAYRQRSNSCRKQENGEKVEGGLYVCTNTGNAYIHRTEIVSDIHFDTIIKRETTDGSIPSFHKVRECACADSEKHFSAADARMFLLQRWEKTMEALEDITLDPADRPVLYVDKEDCNASGLASVCLQEGPTNCFVSSFVRV